MNDESALPHGHSDPFPTTHAPRRTRASDSRRLITLVNLYKDLGGGWIEHTGDAPPRAEDIAPLAPHNNAPWDLGKSIRPTNANAAGAR